jgi:hypothetical protein
MNYTPSSPTQQSNPDQISQPGLLTPVATSPLPFGINERSIPIISLPKSPNSRLISETPKCQSPKIISSDSSFPMVSMLGTPQYNGSQPPLQGVPSMDEINALAQQLASLLSTTNAPVNNIPPLNLPPVTQPPLNLPPTGEVGALTQQLASLLSTTSSPVNNVPPLNLPSLNLPSRPAFNLASVSQSNLPAFNLPAFNLPTFNLPSVSRSNLPALSLPQVTPFSTQFPSVTIPSNSLPTISVPNLPSIQLPSISLPNFEAQSLNLPTIGRSNLPTVNLSNFDTLGLFVPTTLADNEIGDLRWNRPNPPQPILITSSYRRVGCTGDGSCFFHAVSKGLSEIYQLSYRTFEDISEETLRRFEQSVDSAITFPSSLFTTPRGDDLSVRYTFAQPYGRNAFSYLMSSFRGAYVRMLRQDFANQVLNDSRMQGLIRQRLSGSIDLQIDTLIARGLENGQILSQEEVQDQAFRDVIRRLSAELLSGNAVQPDFMLLLSDYVNIDIYLLRDADLINPNPRNSPLYSGASLHAAVHGPVDMRPENDIYAELPNRRAIVIISIDDFHYEIVARVDESEGQEPRNRQIHPNMDHEEPLIRRLYEMLVYLRSP